MLAYILIFIISPAGIIQIVIYLSRNEKPNFGNILPPIRSNLRRIIFGAIIYSLLLFLMLAFFCSFTAGFIIEIANSKPQISETGFYLFLGISYLTGIPYTNLLHFYYCSLLVHKKGIWDGIRYSLGIVFSSSNLKRLFVINLLYHFFYAFILYTFSLVILFFQSNFSLDFADTFNLSTYLAVSNTVAFRFGSMVVSFIGFPLIITVLTLAYLDFTGESSIEEGAYNPLT